MRWGPEGKHVQLWTHDSLPNRTRGIWKIGRSIIQIECNLKLRVVHIVTIYAQKFPAMLRRLPNLTTRP